MKGLFALLIATLVAGFGLTACSTATQAPPTVTPAPTVVSAPTQANPTALPSPTAKAEPTVAPTATSLPGTAVSFDRLSLTVPTGLGTGGSGTLVPEAKGDSVAPWDVAPEHIQFKLEGYPLDGKMFPPQIYVYPAQAYAQVQERGTAAQSLEQLRAVLASGAMVNVKELPQVPFFNVSQALAARVKVIPFHSGRGVRMLTQYAMARTIINNYELFYHFEGLTDDGQYYIVAVLPVSAPGLPEKGEPGTAAPKGGVPIPDWNDMNANYQGYYGDVRQMLQDLEPGAIKPDLDRLDALIGSLNIATANK